MNQVVSVIAAFEYDAWVLSVPPNMDTISWVILRQIRIWREPIFIASADAKRVSSGIDTLDITGAGELGRAGARCDSHRHGGNGDRKKKTVHDWSLSILDALVDCSLQRHRGRGRRAENSLSQGLGCGIHALVMGVRNAAIY